jgi:Rod binding domain-containing protein
MNFTNLRNWSTAVMSNSLTSIDSSFLSKDLGELNEVKSKLKGKINNGGKSFTELFKEKIKSDGSINQSKLDKQETKLYGACIDMESLLWKQVLNEMKKTVNKYRLTEESQAENVFTDFLYDEYATMMAKNSNTRISDELFKQLSGYK